MRGRIIGLSCGLGMSVIGWAHALSMPMGATQTAQVAEPLASDSIAIGPYRNGAAQLRQIDGRLTRTAWRIGGSDATTLQVMGPLRAQLKNQSYDIAFECETTACGGFDFRYALAVISEPEMHVDLGDFRYLLAEKAGPTGTDHVMLLVSRSTESSFVQMTEVGPYDPNAVTTAASSKSPEPDVPATQAVTETATPDFDTTLEADGQVALDDLVFETGAATLGPGPFPSLTALAKYLAAHSDRTITLVGHTDAVGPLNVNVAISKKRAQAVVDSLVADYGVNAGQLSAQGVGFLSPRASNLTDAGRTENRRVEAILTSTQ